MIELRSYSLPCGCVVEMLLDDAGRQISEHWRLFCSREHMQASSVTELTDEQIDAMEAGEEMDWAVAAVVGLRMIPMEEGPSEQHPYPWISRRKVTRPRPSKDWKDAMFAAERFGLFDVEHRCELTCNHGEWIVSSELREPVASSRSGPLVICRAILKLANRR